MRLLFSLRNMNNKNGNKENKHSLLNIMGGSFIVSLLFSHDILLCSLHI